MTWRVWVVGASYGIGAALARHLASDGHEVWASARSADKLEAMARESGGRIHALPLDVTDKTSTQAAHEAIEAAGGPPDIVVLNAGSHQPVDARDFKAEELRRLIELNIMGVANGIEVVLPGMIARNRGRLAVVASVAGYSGLPTSAYYGCTKGGVINMVESLAFDLRKTGVKLQLINPGFVKTPLTDKNEFEMPFLVSAEDAAESIAKGLASNRFEIAFPRVFVLILKALRMLPYRLYFALVGRGTSK